MSTARPWIDGATRLLRGAALAVPVLSEFRVARPTRPLTSKWERLPVEPAGSTQLGISFRPLQAAALGLDPSATLTELLTFPFALIRLAAYWDQLQPELGALDTRELDGQIEAAVAAGKHIVLCVGAVKAFGYPEFFVPSYELPEPLPEHELISPRSHPRLAAAAAGFAAKIVERYRRHPAIVAWQIEHEPVDPLGLEHSWRLSADFVRREADAVRAADPTRPVIMTGFVPTSTVVRLHQRWRTRDQGDSLAVASQLADIVGLNIYPRHGLARIGPWNAYLTGGDNRWQRHATARLLAGSVAGKHQFMVSEGQAEPWETVTTPPSVASGGMFSCLPEHVIGNYNDALRLGRRVPGGLWAYLFWGAEYWLKRRDQGDRSYLSAFARLLADSGGVLDHSAGAL